MTGCGGIHQPGWDALEIALRHLRFPSDLELCCLCSFNRVITLPSWDLDAVVRQQNMFRTIFHIVLRHGFVDPLLQPALNTFIT